MLVRKHDFGLQVKTEKNSIGFDFLFLKVSLIFSAVLLRYKINDCLILMCLKRALMCVHALFPEGPAQSKWTKSGGIHCLQTTLIKKEHTPQMKQRRLH